MCFGSAPQAPEIVYKGPSQADIDRNNAALDQYRQQSMTQQQQFASALQKQIDDANATAAQRQRVAEQERAMQAAVAAQQAEMARLEQEQVAAQANQQQQVAQLQAQEQQQLAQIQQMKDATNTVGATLRILATRPTDSAPTASQSKASKAGGARTTSATSGLRIGSSSVSSGVGVNLGG